MVTEILALFSSSICQSQETGFNQRAKAFFEQRSQIRVDRIHFQQHDGILDEQFVENVHWPDARNIAGPQYQHDLAGVFFVLVSQCLRLRKLLRRDARLHPDLCRDTAKKEAIIGRLREDTRDDLAVRPHRQRAGDARAPVDLDVDQRATQLTQILEYRPRPQRPLFAGQRRIRRDTFSLLAGADPARRHGGKVFRQPLDKRDTLVYRKRHPGILIGLQGLHCGIHRLTRRWLNISCNAGKLRGTAPACRRHDIFTLANLDLFLKSNRLRSTLLIVLNFEGKVIMDL